MYGIFREKQHLQPSIYGENGRTYFITPETPIPDGAYVAFERLSSEDGRPRAKITRVIGDTPPHRSALGACLKAWDQEATRDSGPFVHTRVYEEIRDGRKCLIIGRKGVGKSAIVKQLLHEMPVGQVFSFDQFNFQEFYKFREPGFTHSRYKPLWIILYVALALSILARHPETPESLKKRLRDLKGLRGVSQAPRAVSMLHSLFEHPLLETLSAAANLTPLAPVNVIPLIKSFLATLRKREKEAGADAENLQATQDELVNYYRSLEQKPRVVVAFDQLDEEYKQSNSNDYADLIESLFAATSWLADQNRNEATALDIQPVVLLRDDIFETKFETNNKTKYRTYITTPEWTHHNLREVLRSRLASAVPGNACPADFDDLWLSVFVPFFPKNERKLNADRSIGIDSEHFISSYECFIRHTSRTPRDCIELLKSCFASFLKAGNEAKVRCDHEIFRDARSEFAKYFYEQILDSTKTALPRIDEILEALREQCQGDPTIGKDKFADYIKPYLEPVPGEERVDRLLETLASTNEAEGRKIVLTEIAELKARIAAAQKAQVSNILDALWSASAIGLLDEHYVFRARYLVNEPFAVKGNDRIVFHPALGIQLRLNISIAGMPWSLADADGELTAADSDAWIFGAAQLGSAGSREAAAKALAGQAWKLRLPHDATLLGGEFLSNEFFPDGVYCERGRLPVDANPGMILVAEVGIESNYFGLTKNVKSNAPIYTVRRFMDADGAELPARSRYLVRDLNDAATRDAILRELSGKYWTACVAQVGDGYLFLAHEAFSANIFCSHKLVRQAGLSGVKAGDTLDICVSGEDIGARWSYTVSQVKGNAASASKLKELSSRFGQAARR